MDNWKLTKGMFKDFHFFYHDIDQLSFGRGLRYARPFLICSFLMTVSFAMICQEHPEIDKAANEWKYKYLDI